MRVRVTQAILMAMAVLSLSAFAEGISRAEVDALIKKMDTGINTKNVEAVSDTLSDNINITINIEMFGSKQVMTPNKQTYITLLRDGWKTYEQYTYKRTDEKVQLEPTKAIIQATVTESFVVGGTKITGVTQETSVAEKVDGKLLFTQITGDSKM
ncbi:Uncharacterised protein [BD1-7 clade bacterium]|uniref:DUF4440 domain-containing protein n=1 Tax=BD1-7 clade bacterium TaxID=2029982 RepID=A0A5S9Q764_9GAMM|nr:Uncharacterised protein [BD1-7 clade bacterium]CAA0113133.1 Uncharacterised protein [BD1-7 clade bacterium]